MSPATAPILDRLLDPFAQCLTPEVAARMVNIPVAPELQSRLNELADKANSGRLSAQETAEYEQYVEGFDLVAILQTQARLVLADHGGA